LLTPLRNHSGAQPFLYTPAVAAALDARQKLWFFGGAAVDSEIAARFAPDLAALAAGGLDGWAGGARRPLDALAGVIAADQFSRNVFRGTPAAFTLDSRAVGWAERLMAMEEVEGWPVYAKVRLVLWGWLGGVGLRGEA